MNKQDFILYWVKSSNDDLSSMESIYQSGKYDWALFIGHLSLEKILKALWVKNRDFDFPPRTHNLKKIAEEAGYNYSDEEEGLFIEINSFNIEVRYPDYKMDFHRKCTREFAEEYISKIKELHRCIASQI